MDGLDQSFLGQQESLASDTIPSAISTLVVAATFTCLRFASRRLSKAGLWFDDWIQIPALAFAILTAVAVAAPVAQSFEKDDEQLLATGASQDSYLGHVLLYGEIAGGQDIGHFLEELGWCLAISTVKYSILAFYWRLFATRKRARKVLYACFGVVTCWMIAIIFSVFFQCFPFNKHFHTSEDLSCNNSIIRLSTTAPHILIDVAILLLPLPWVWKVAQMSKSQRIRTLLVFALGGLATACSIVRFFYICMDYTSSSASLGSMGVIVLKQDIWTIVEVNVAIMSSCLPTLRPILSFIAQRFRGLLARLPTLRPILNFLAQRFRAFKQHMNKSKRGEDLLLEMVSPPKDKRADEPRRSGTDDDRKAGLDIEQLAEGCLENMKPGELHAEPIPMPELASVHIVSELPATEAAVKRWSTKGA